MGKWTNTTAGLIFLAAASVYADREIAANLRSSANAAAPAKATLAVNYGKVAPGAVAKADVRVIAAPAEAKTVAKVISAPAEASTDVKLLEESSDPFASAPATQPATQPAAGEGKSVSNQEVNVSDAGAVEIHVNDANLVEVLRMLSLQSQKNIIASKEVRGTVTANLYDVSVREALDAILHANGYGYREKGNFIYVYTAKELADIEKSEKQMKTEVFHLFYTPAANASTMIKPVLSTIGQVAVTTPAQVGIGSTPNAAGGNDHATEDMLVVTDYPENLEAVKRVLAEVDHRPQQILLEATVLRASLNEDNALGIDFTVLGGVDFAGLSTATSSAGELLSGAITGNSSAQGVVKQNAAGAGTGFTQGLPTGGVRVGVVTSNVAMFLQALEQTTDTTVLANPKVLTLNKQKGEVFVGNEDGYYTTVTTETTTSQQVDTLKTGTRLIFRPYIGNDGFIRLEVHPEDSDGSVKANGLPSKTTTEVTSDIMVQDGHTVVIGGLFRESSITNHSQVPFLGNIPLAGLLFKNQRDRTVRDEIIILLTPHIIKDEAAYSALSDEQMKHAEDMRVGVRKGMMPFGRERLAQSAYECAKKELAKPHPDRHLAIWHLNEATNLNPHFTEAIELKEQLTGKVVTESDNGSIRSFVKQAIMRDVAPTTAPAAHTVTDSRDEDAVPTTMPTAEAPSTQPSDEMADSDTTSPHSDDAAMTDEKSASASEAEDSATAETSTTQPSSEVAEVGEEPTTPTTQPAKVVAEKPTTQPATQPTVSTEKTDADTKVTELPYEEVAPEAEK